MPDFRATGVRNGKRAYDWPCIIRCINTVDVMTAEVPGICRVCYDLTPKPVGSESDQTVELWVLSTLDADSKKNLNGVYYKNAGSVGSSGTTGPSISFDENSFVDNYYLNKNRYDKLFAGTNYGCWSDTVHHLQSPVCRFR